MKTRRYCCCCVIRLTDPPVHPFPPLIAPPPPPSDAAPGAVDLLWRRARRGRTGVRRRSLPTCSPATSGTCSGAQTQASGRRWPLSMAPRRRPPGYTPAATAAPNQTVRDCRCEMYSYSGRVIQSVAYFEGQGECRLLSFFVAEGVLLSMQGSFMPWCRMEKRNGVLPAPSGVPVCGGAF